MALFEKGNKMGNRFTSDNQPPKERVGRKPSVYKYIKTLTGVKVNPEMSKEDYLKVIRYLMERSSEELEPLVKGADNKVNPKTPIWVVNIISAINSDIRYGRTSTVEMLFDRVFGKSTQNIDGNIEVASTIDLSVLSTDELMQYNALLEKIRNSTSTNNTKE